MQIVGISERIQVSPERFTKRILHKHPDVLVFVLTFAPGQSLPAHRHPGSAVVMQAWSGSGLLTVDGQSRPLAAGDVALITGDQELSVHNDGAGPLALVVSLSPNPTNTAYSKELG